MATRTANGDGSLRQRKDGTWEYRVVIGYDDNQFPIRKSFYGKSKTEPKRKYKEWLQTPEEVRIERVTTIGEWAAVWLETYKKGKVEFGTFRNYEMYVNNNIIPEIGKIKFEDIRPAHIERLMRKLDSKSLSARRHVKIALNGIFETAIDNNFCTANPCRKLTLAKETNKEPEVFTVSEIETILKEAPKVTDGAIIEFLLYTGMRIGEAAALLWGDVKEDEKIIIVRQAAARAEYGGYETKSTKSGKERAIGISDKLAKLIKTMPKNGIYVFSKSSLVAPNPYSLGKRYRKALEDINANIIKRAEKKGIEPVTVRELTPHKCRHTYATYLLKGGANIRQVQSLLGHCNVSVTEIYTHIDTDDIKKSVSKLPY